MKTITIDEGWLRSVLYINTLRAYPKKSHEEISGEIARLLAAAPQSSQQNTYVSSPTIPASDYDVAAKFTVKDTTGDDNRILKLALHETSIAMDVLIGDCMGDDGKPKAPSRKVMMRARGFLPPYCQHALAKRSGFEAPQPIQPSKEGCNHDCNQGRNCKCDKL